MQICRCAPHAAGMSPPQVQPTRTGYAISVSTAVAHAYDFVDQVFSPENVHIAQEYKPWKRCSLIVDCNVHALYGNQIEAYFDNHHISVRLVQIEITEDQKNISSLLNVCEILKGFELLRREPVLVVGGGLTTDVVGYQRLMPLGIFFRTLTILASFACAIYRRGTPYIRVPTTLVGLVDASIATKVAVNWNGSKNQLGAFYEPVKTVIDFHFLRSLPLPEIRNGLAEIIKVAACTQPEIVELLEKHGNELVNTKVGQSDGASDSLVAASELILKESKIHNDTSGSCYHTLPIQNVRLMLKQVSGVCWRRRCLTRGSSNWTVSCSLVILGPQY